jgi:predicted short-subunit dehydrogenase-like oxidoreductase (DUF2520 family)
MDTNISNITIIGTGNVAYHLAKAFLASGGATIRVVARSAGSARRFSDALPVKVVISGEMQREETDLFILAVSDDGIASAAKSLDFGEALVVHTSGSVPMDILETVSANTGVFYPLQTLTFGQDADFSQVPILIESNSNRNSILLRDLASKISKKVYDADSETRAMIHLAAVFASNFTYHMYTVASRILASKDLPADILKPLILETARKAVDQPADEAQTGPAARNDLEVLSRHRTMLSGHELYGRIYDLLSESIIIHQNTKKK